MFQEAFKISSLIARFNLQKDTYFHKSSKISCDIEISQKSMRAEIDHQPSTQSEDVSLPMTSNNSQHHKIFAIEKTKKIETVKDFSNRQDVVNKAALRKMRKYYLKVFKSSNKKLVRLRFCNLKSSEIIRAAKTFLKNELGVEADLDELCYYLIGILKIRNLLKMQWSENTKHEVNQFLDWVRNYSKNKFDKLFKSESLKLN